MKKLCLSCFSKIPILASKCPYCIEKGQSVTGRILLWLLLLGGIYVGAMIYSKHSNYNTTNQIYQKGGNTEEHKANEEKLKELLKSVN